MKSFIKLSLVMGLTGSLLACGSEDVNGNQGGPGTADSHASSSSIEPALADLADNVLGAERSIDINNNYSWAQDSLICQKAQGEAACGLITYQIMVESFINRDHSIGFASAYGSSHHQGDLQGIIDSLDYIKSLGVNAIWLTPIFDSQGDKKIDASGYFTKNYFAIDPHFGSMETARELVNKAHDLGLYVFFDGVFGHHKGSPASSPNGLTASNGEPQGEVGFEAIYPDDIDFYKEVATFWIKELKIDGWRLDQAYQVPTYAWTEIREAVEQASEQVSYKNADGKPVNPLGYMVAEIWSGKAQNITDQAYGYESDPALLSSFAFPMRYSLVQTLAVEESGWGNAGASQLVDYGFTAQNSYPSHAMPNLMLTNHDLVRFGDLLQRGELSSPELPSYWARHKAAFSFMTAYSGPITLYYGDEIGDQVVNFASWVNCGEDGGKGSSVGHCDDHVSRNSGKIEGLSGDFVLNDDQADLKNYVGKLMQVRAENPALYNGSRTHVYSDDDLYVDLKQAGDNKVLYLLNTKNKQLNVTVSSNAAGTSGDLTDLVDGTVYSNTGGEYGFTLAPFEALLLKAE